MENTKYVSTFLVSAILVSAQSASAMSMGNGFMNSDTSSTLDNAQTTASQAADSADSSSDSATSDNGDAIVSDAQSHDGDYTVNGDLHVQGVLFVKGNLSVNGDMTVEQNAKVRVLGTIDANGDFVNNGGSVYAGKKSISGDNKGKARKLDSQVADVDQLLSAKIAGEEREAILADVLESKSFVRTSRLSDFLDSLNDKIDEQDTAAFEKVKTKLIAALDRKIKQMGGLKETQLAAFSAKLETMPTDKLEKFVEKLSKLEAATKKKRFAFQLAQIKELTEEVIDSRQTSADEPTVTVPTPTSTTAPSAATSTGTTSTTSSGANSTASASGTTLTNISASGSTSTTTSTGTASTTTSPIDPSAATSTGTTSIK